MQSAWGAISVFGFICGQTCEDSMIVNYGIQNWWQSYEVSASFVANRRWSHFAQNKTRIKIMSWVTNLAPNPCLFWSALPPGSCYFVASQHVAAVVAVGGGAVDDAVVVDVAADGVVGVSTATLKTRTTTPRRPSTCSRLQSCPGDSFSRWSSSSSRRSASGSWTLTGWRGSGTGPGRRADASTWHQYYKTDFAVTKLP